MTATTVVYAPGTSVRCRLASGHVADCVVVAVRHFPVDFLEVQFEQDGRRMAFTGSAIASAITPV
ncbi:MULTISPECIES: hypothetical protein [Gordonia]|uniref:Uncharacterized protein n=1 Tax=Gordonia cholesterolivorans TaxID=559625 RepID=A0ABN3H3U5_9ACTN|nr:hypothetical protein [Gordonia sihwensis]